MKNARDRAKVYCLLHKRAYQGKRCPGCNAGRKRVNEVLRYVEWCDRNRLEQCREAI